VIGKKIGQERGNGRACVRVDRFPRQCSDGARGPCVPITGCQPPGRTSPASSPSRKHGTGRVC